MLRALIAETGGAMPDVAGQILTTTYYITPADGGLTDEMRVGPERRIAPGDTLRLARRLVTTGTEDTALRR
jgi:hypothetical protein